MSETHKKIELLDGETLLLESEEWAVILDSSDGRGAILAYGSHEECTVSFDPKRAAPGNKYYYGEYSWLPEDPPTCKYCNEPVPDGIQAIVHLRNWGLRGET
jgi:hypothetical protein